MAGKANIAKKALISTPVPMEQPAASRSGPGRTKLLLEDKKGIHDHDQSSLKFSDVVDEDIAHLEERISIHLLGKLLESLAFRMLMLCFILMNCMVIGIQTDKYLETHFMAVLYAVDHGCLTVFVVEIILKWYHDFLAFWKSGWNILDFFIVAAAIVGPHLSFLGSGSRVLRSLRVFRALRSLRSISVLAGLQVIVQTIILSLPDMANIVALLLIIMFVFSVLGVSFFGEACPQYFGSLGSAMFSLFICITQDGWMAIKDVFESSGNGIVGAIFLVTFITIGAFIFANLVVADLVANLELAISEQNRHNEKQSKEEGIGLVGNVAFTDATPILMAAGYGQDPLENPEINLKIEYLEIFYTVLSAIEANLVEFKTVKENIAQIVQDVKALAVMDELSDDEVFEISTMLPYRNAQGESVSRSTLCLPSAQGPPQQPSLQSHRASLPTDALSGLIRMSQTRRIHTSHANSIQQLIIQLRSRSLHSLKPSSSTRVTMSSSASSGHFKSSDITCDVKDN